MAKKKVEVPAYRRADGTLVEKHARVQEVGRSEAQFGADVASDAAAYDFLGDEVPSVPSDCEVSLHRILSVAPGTPDGVSTYAYAVHVAYGDREGLTVDDRVERFREATRANSQLADLETEVSEQLHKKTNGKEVQTLFGTVKPVQAKTSKERFDEDKIWNNIVADAVENPIDVETGQEVSVERSVVSRAQHMMASPTFRSNQIRREGLKIHAEWRPEVDPDGNEVKNVVLMESGESAEDQEQFRDAMVAHLRPIGVEPPEILANRLAHIHDAREAVRDQQYIQAQRIIEEAEYGKPSETPNGDMWEVRQSGSYAWRADSRAATFADLADRVETTLPRGTTKMKAQETAKRVRDVVGPTKWKKRPLKAAGLQDANWQEPGGFRVEIEKAPTRPRRR